MPTDRDVIPTKVVFVNDVRMQAWLNDSLIAHVAFDDGTGVVELIGSPSRIIGFVRQLTEALAVLTDELIREVTPKVKR